MLVTGYALDVDKPYFEILNNWGTSWGSQGFMKIPINDFYSTTDSCSMFGHAYNILVTFS